MQEDYISFAPTKEHYSLILEVNDLFGGQDKDIGQQAVLQQSISHFIKISEEKPDKIGGILRRAAWTKVQIRQDIDEVIPKSLKFRVDKDAYKKAEDLFMKALGLVRIRKPYFMRVILTNYYLMMQEEKLQEEKREFSAVSGSQSAVASFEPVKENGQCNTTEMVCDIQGQGKDETLEKLQRLKEYGIVADMLLRSAPEDEIYIQKIVDIAKAGREKKDIF